MQAQAYHRNAAGAETTIAFKRHILECSSGFACEPMADAFRVNLLSRMLDRYDELSEKGMGELACRNRTIYEFGDIAVQMREMGFAQIDLQEDAVQSRWPQMSEDEAMQYIAERDAYMHKTSLGVLLCTACVTPIMIGAALDEFWYSEAFAMLGLVGMFAMIGMGVYAMVTAMKPRGEKRIKKGRFSLARSLRRKLEALQVEMQEKARRRKGRGIAMIVTSMIPVFTGAALSEIWYSDAFPMLGLAGMFLMIGAGVYELVMADGEKKTVGRLLKNKE